MERYSQINEEELELLKKILIEQGVSSLRSQSYLDPRLIIRDEPSLQERAEFYHKLTKKVDILAGVASIVLATFVPFKDISFTTFAVILFASRLADILSTIFCLQMPWMIEANPRCDAHSLSPEFVFRHLIKISLNLVPAYLLSLWFPVPVKILLLTYAIGGFIATASNLYQVFSLNKTNTAILAISNGAIGTGIYFLLKSFFN